MSIEVMPSARGTSARWRKSLRVLPNYLYVLPYLVLFGVFSAGPLCYSAYMSLYDRKLFSINPPFVGLKNYQDMWSDPLWITVLQNTVEFVVITVLVLVVVALLAALLLRALPRGQTLFRTLLFAPAVLSVGIYAIIWGWLFTQQNGAINYLLSLVGISPQPFTADAHWVIPSLSLSTVWWNFGFPMVVFLAGLLNIPEALYEAAAIDGAGPVARFFTITLPLLRPTILFVGVTQVIAQFQVFGQSYFVTSGGPGDASRTILMYLYNVVWVDFQYGYGAAVAMTLALVMAAITAIQFLFLGRSAEG